MSILIRHARIVDPAGATDEIGDVLIEGDRVAEVGRVSGPAERVIEADGLVAAPGLVDMHVHFREPGDEEAETIASGSAAAVAGGFTTVCVMPNTTPPIDTEAAAEFVVLQGKRAGKADVFPVGAVTKGLAGERLSEMGGLVRGGAVAFSDDGNPIRSAAMLRRALLYSRMFDKVIIDHAVDADLASDGVMNSGVLSAVLGLPGVSAAAEDVAVARDIRLAEVTGGRLHVAHLSTAGAVDLVRDAKSRGISVTSEVTPHHLLLTEELVETFDPNFKMSPPLRTEADREALVEGLLDGTVDAIATDHAPHTSEAKELEFSFAPFGVIGLETALAVVYTRLVADGPMSLLQMVEKMSTNPARILGLESKGALRPGACADIVLFDVETPWTIDPARFFSKSRNTPFAGMEVRGRVRYTIVSGRVVYDSQE